MGIHNRTCRFRLESVLLIVLYACAIFISFLSNTYAVYGLSEDQLKQLKKGEILVSAKQTGKTSKGMVAATILIEAPAEKIWKIMTDCSEIPAFVPGLKSCEVLDSGENWEIIRHETKLVWLLPRIDYVFRADYETNRKIDFFRIRGDLREMKGSWRLTPLDQGHQTIVSYSVYLDPGFFVPKWMVRKSLKANLPEVLTSIRTRVLENRTEP